MCDRLMRFEGEQTLPGDRDAPLKAQGLLLNAMNVAPEHEAEFNECYQRSTYPRSPPCTARCCARRFRAPQGSPCYVALYHLASPDALASKPWKDAANTPWTSKLRPHFHDHLRIVARRYMRR